MPFFNKVPIDLFLVMCYDEPEEIHFLVRLEEWYEQESETNRSYTLAVAVLMAIAFVMRELIVDRDYQPHIEREGDPSPPSHSPSLLYHPELFEVF